MNLFVEFLCTICQVIRAIILGVFYSILPPSKKVVDGEVVLITGAGSGLGRTMCFEFAKRGAIIVALDINKEANNQTKEKIEKKGGIVHAYECNVG